MPKTAPRAPRGRLLRAGAAVLVLLAVAGYLIGQYLTGGRTAPRCEVTAGDGGHSYEFTSEQAVNAATISAVGGTEGMPERAVTIALATALQESGLRNLPHGDRDSIGLFQQRPSQGWGTEKQIMDPVYSAEEFYRHLDKVPGYSRLPLTVAAQRVQRSGYPQAYAKHEPDATVLAAALTGRDARSLTCEGRPALGPGDAAKVRRELVRDFGPGILPDAATAGAERGGGSAGNGQDARATDDAEDAADAADADDTRDGEAAGPQGRTVTVPLSPPDPTRRGASAQGPRGWALAHWAVAKSQQLRIDRVSYAGREWRASDEDGDWHEVGPAPGSGAAGSSTEGAGKVVIDVAR